MSTQETTTQTPSSKKAKASKKAARSTKAAAKPKKVAKASKAKSTARSGSKAEKVLELMKRKEGGARGDRQSNRLAEPQHSQVRQRARDQEAWVKGRVDEERGGGAELPDRELNVSDLLKKPPQMGAAFVVVLAHFAPWARRPR
jgi:hypothetical protein